MVKKNVKAKKPYNKFLKGTRVLLRQFPKLRIENGILVRKSKARTQIVLPEKFRDWAFKELHVNMGHLGIDKTEELCRQRFYWPYLREDLSNFIQQNCTCIANKTPSSFVSHSYVLPI